MKPASRSKTPQTRKGTHTASRPHLVLGISELAQPHLAEEPGRVPLEVTADAALLVKNGRVIAAGPRNEVQRHPLAKRAQTLDVGGRAVIPGLVDAHTHLVFAGNRIDEFARRARGESYEEIARAGGGIARSVEPLRQSTLAALVREATPRLVAMVSRGTTTLEAKSGYGLSPEAELKQLRAIAALAKTTPVDIVPTVLAHVVPKDAAHDRAAYIQRFCSDVIAAAAQQGLAQFCDIFVETVAFTADEARTLATAAKSHGLKLRLHVDQLNDGQGAALAAELNAISADHLEMTPPSGAAALARAHVVAVILPGCALFIGKGPWPNGRMLRDEGCTVAIATDCNPGSSMVTDLPLCATLASTRCGLSLEEALFGITRAGALSLGLTDRGTLRAGELADFVVLDHSDWRALFYWPGDAPLWGVFKRGRALWRRKPASRKGSHS